MKPGERLRLRLPLSVRLGDSEGTGPENPSRPVCRVRVEMAKWLLTKSAGAALAASVLTAAVALTVLNYSAKEVANARVLSVVLTVD